MKIVRGKKAATSAGQGRGDSNGSTLAARNKAAAKLGCRSQPIPVLSFFTGGGFLDLGFERAGFRTSWSNEYNAIFADLHDHAYTAWRRAGNPKAEAAKITSRESIRKVAADSILEEAFGSALPGIFGAIGGPPCTDFSVGGINAGASGSHGRLTGVYISKLLDLNPGFFVLENVPGLRRTQKHAAYFQRKMRELSARYHVHVNVLNALHVGVPQDRDRLFVIGIRKDLDSIGASFDWPDEPTFAGAKELEWPGENVFRKRIAKPKGLPEKLMVHTAFNGEKGVEHLPNGQEWFTPYSKKFKAVPEGRVSTKSFKRLHRYRYSPTAWYGNNEVHLHPTETRRLSVREALRLQSVPDEYVLPEDAPLSCKFKIICNGVPVLLAERVAEAVKAHLSKIGAFNP